MTRNYFVLLMLVVLTTGHVNGQCTVDEVRLSGGASGSSYASGRVEICLSGSWRAFRFDYFTLQNGQAVCRDLFPAVDAHAVSVISVALPTTVSVAPVSFRCLGNEASLTSCSSLNNGAFGEVAILTCKLGSQDGDLRIVGNNASSAEGVLQHFGSGLWRSLYRRSPARWTAAESEVVCKLLGYSTGTPEGTYYIDPSSGPNATLTALGCNSTDVSLGDCGAEVGEESASPADSVIAITCEPAGNTVADGTLRVVGTDGNVLDNSKIGVVEMAYQGRWGALCYNTDIGGNEETVLCNSLGYRSGGIATNASLQTFASKPFWLDAFTCAASEDNVLRCSNFAVGIIRTNSCRSDYLLRIACEASVDQDSYTAAVSPGGITAILVVFFLTFGFAFPFVFTGAMYCKESSNLDCDCIPSPRSTSHHRISSSPRAASSALRPRITEATSTGLGEEPTGDNDGVEGEIPSDAVLSKNAPPTYVDADNFEKVDLSTGDKPPEYLNSNRDGDLPPYPPSNDLPYPATPSDPAYPPTL